MTTLEDYQLTQIFGESGSVFSLSLVPYCEPVDFKGIIPPSYALKPYSFIEERGCARLRALPCIDETPEPDEPSEAEAPREPLILNPNPTCPEALAQDDRRGARLAKRQQEIDDVHKSAVYTRFRELVVADGRRPFDPVAPDPASLPNDSKRRWAGKVRAYRRALHRRVGDALVVTAAKHRSPLAAKHRILDDLDQLDCAAAKHRILDELDCAAACPDEFTSPLAAAAAWLQWLGWPATAQPVAPGPA